MSAIPNGGQVPKQTPYGRINNFNETARYTISIKRDGYTAASMVSSLGVSDLTGAVLIYDGDIIEVAWPGANGVPTDIFTVQRLNSGSWTDVTQIAMSAFQKRRVLNTTVTGNASTSNVSFTG